jgi:phosphoribosylformylglycinamidine synthase
MDLGGVRDLAGLSDAGRLFSESTTRWLIEVEPSKAAVLAKVFAGLPLLAIGKAVPEPRLRIAGGDGSWLIWATLDELKAAWQTSSGL